MDRYDETAERILEDPSVVGTYGDGKIIYDISKAASILRESFPEPAPAEHGEGRIAEMRRKAEALQDTEWREGYLDALHDIEMTPLRLASRPQPEAAQDVRELAKEAYKYIEGNVFAWMRRENGTPDPDIKPQIIDWLAYKIEARLASARAEGDAERWAIDLVHLIRDSGEVSNGDAAFKVMTFVESRARELEKPLRDYAELAERKVEEIRAEMIDRGLAWLSSGLIKPNQAQRDSFRAALATPAEGATK
jgi:hypothetical protein